MEAYQATSGGYTGEQPEPTGVYLGPAWLLACGLGAILGGFFMRGTSFSWPLMMLGVGVGLVGATMLYRNIMRVRRRRQALAAAGPGGLGPAGGLPLAALQLPLAFAAAGGSAQMGRPGAAAGGAPRRVPPTYLVSLDRVGWLHQPEGKQQQQMQMQDNGGLEASSTRSHCQAGAGVVSEPGVPPGALGTGGGPGPCGVGTQAEQAAWLEGLLPGPDFIALGVPLPGSSKASSPYLPGAEPPDGRARGALDLESGRGRRAGNSRGGAAEAGPHCDVAARRSGARLKPGGGSPGEGRVDAAEGFVLVLQPEPQLLGFTACICREEDPPEQHQQSEAPRPQQQLLLLRFPRRISYPDSEPDEDAESDPMGGVAPGRRRPPVDERPGSQPPPGGSSQRSRRGSQGLLQPQPRPQPHGPPGPSDPRDEEAPQLPLQYMRVRRQERRISMSQNSHLEPRPHHAHGQGQEQVSLPHSQEHPQVQRLGSPGDRRAGGSRRSPASQTTRRSPPGPAVATAPSGSELQLPPLEDSTAPALALVLAPAEVRGPQMS